MNIVCPSCHHSVPEEDASGCTVRCVACGSALTPDLKGGAGRISVSGAERTYIPAVSDLPPDQLTAIGDYILIEEIARGGMGIVYKARQQSLNRVVALKMILSGATASSQELKRFCAEAEAVAQLRHPGIVPIYEVGEFEGHHFLTLEYVEGGNLADRLRDGPLPPAEAAELVRRIAEAVQFAHDHGVIHRDLKPRNILLNARGDPLISDFGLAKSLTQDAALTVTGQVLGTPAYMSPEQARGLQPDKAMDVYSLGATIYCLLTGKPPFQAATSHETVQLILEREPVPPRQINPSITRDLETICLKSLRKEPARRYATAAALADDLSRWLQQKPILARPVGRAEKLWLWSRRRPAVAALLGTVCLAAVMAALLIVVVKTGQHERQDLNTQLVWKRYLAQVLQMDRLATRARSADYPQAVQEAEDLLDSGKLTPMVIYDLACVFALASASARSDDAISSDVRQRRSREFSRRAMETLELAHQWGYFTTPEHRALLKEDPDLAAIRTEERFRLFVDRIEDSEP